MIQYQLGSGSDGCELGRAQPRPGEVKDFLDERECAARPLLTFGTMCG